MLRISASSATTGELWCSWYRSPSSVRAPLLPATQRHRRAATNGAQSTLSSVRLRTPLVRFAEIYILHLYFNILYVFSNDARHAVLLRPPSKRPSPASERSGRQRRSLHTKGTFAPTCTQDAGRRSTGGRRVAIPFATLRAPNPGKAGSRMAQLGTTKRRRAPGRSADPSASGQHTPAEPAAIRVDQSIVVARTPARSYP